MRFGDGSSRGVSEDQKRTGRRYVAGASVVGAGTTGVGMKLTRSNSRAKRSQAQASAQFESQSAARSMAMRKYPVAAARDIRQAAVSNFNPVAEKDPDRALRNLRGAASRSRKQYGERIAPVDAAMGAARSARDSAAKKVRSTRYGKPLIAAGAAIPLAALATRNKVARTWGAPQRPRNETAYSASPTRGGLTVLEEKAARTRTWSQQGTGRKYLNPESGRRERVSMTEQAARESDAARIAARRRSGR